ncbi:YncE family protein, partial [Acidianus sp. RZ1]|uniref:YncE family protein n=1 Tax=Acidianus sp. RZ1 TaxID=1540082 RepID=UPI00149138A8
MRRKYLAFMLLFLSLIPLSSMAGLIPVQHAEYGVFQGTIFLNNDSFVASNYEGFNPGLGTDRLAFNPLNNYIYVTNSFNNSVYVINGTKIVGRLNIPRFPTDIVFNPINGYIYVADAGSNEVTIIKNMTVIANVKVGDSPHGLAVTSSG